MKPLLFITFGIVLCFAGIGCEMHPASKTVKGYAEKEAGKKASEEHKASTPLGAESDSPAYFPAQKSE